MVIQNVHLKQSGASLIEFMVASLIGVIAIGVIGSLFISGQKIASERSKELLLVQDISSVMSQIKEDMQRAGFNGMSSGSATLSSADFSIYSEPDIVGYSYRVASSGSSAFQNIVYKREAAIIPATGDALKVCEKASATPLTIASAADSIPGHPCYQVFNDKQISISKLQVTTSSVASDSADSKMVTVSISGYLLQDPSVTHSMSIKTLQRNWQ